MNPPTAPFSIRGQAGKSLDDTLRTLEVLNVSGAVLVLRSLAPDTFTFTIQKPMDGTWYRPEDQQQITVLEAGGRRLFTGKAKVASGLTDGGIPYVFVTVEGPYQWLRDTAVRSNIADDTGVVALRPQVKYPKQATEISVGALLDLAISNGAPVLKGTISAGFPVPLMSFANTTYEAVLLDILSWVSDAGTWVEYDIVGTPKLHVIRRGDARQVAFDYSLGTELVKVELQPRGDLRPVQVRVQSVGIQAGSGKPYWVTETYPAGVPSNPALIQDAVVSGSEYSDSALQSDTPSFDIQTVRAVRGDTLFNFANTRDSFLASLISQYGGGWWRAAQGTMGIAASSSIQWNLGANPTTSGSGSRSLLQVSLTDQQGTRLSNGEWFILSTTDAIPAWYPGITSKQATIAFDIVMETKLASSTRTSTPRAAGESAFAANCYNEWDVWEYPGSSRLYTFHIYRFTQQVTVINQEFSNLQTFYQSAGYAYSNPPPGLAQNLYTAQQWDPHSGAAPLLPGVADVPLPAEVVSITNQADFPSWATVNAPVGSTEITLMDFGFAARVVFDPPIRMDPQALIDRFRDGSRDNITKAT